MKVQFCPDASYTKNMPVLFLRHYSGATHKLGERRAATLKRELAAGRGGKEVVSLMENGYAEFLGPEGEDLPLDELRAEHIK